MKKTITKIALLLLAFVSNSNTAQSFYGQAFYSSKFNTDSIKNPNANLLSDDLLKDILNKATNKEYIMTFNKTESFFEENVSLINNNNLNEISISMIGNDENKIYTSLKDQKLITEASILGKEFLIVEKPKVLDWQMSEETKKIGDYLCYKAVCVFKVSEEEIKEYENFSKNENINSNLIKTKLRQDETVIAWYTLEIPVNFGPDKYYGLPGLILELHNNQKDYLCNKIVLNPKNISKIKVPNKGKIISAEKFKKEQEKIFDNFQTESGSIIIQNN